LDLSQFSEIMILLGLVLFCIFYCIFADLHWLRVCWYVLNNGSKAEIRGIFVILFSGFTNSFLNLFDIFYTLPKLEDLEIHFIIGHPRSGTTNLQKSCCIADKFLAGGTFYDMFFQPIFLKKLVRYMKWTGPLDTILERFNTAGHKITTDEPVEEDFLLLNYFKGAGVVIAFPCVLRNPQLLKRCFQFTDADVNVVLHNVRKVCAFEKTNRYIGCFFQMSVNAEYIRSRGAKVLISKRDPLKCVPSTVQLVANIWYKSGRIPEDKTDGEGGKLMKMLLGIFKDILLGIESESEKPDTKQSLHLSIGTWFKSEKDTLKKVEKFVGVSNLAVMRKEEHHERDHWYTWAQSEDYGVMRVLQNKEYLMDYGKYLKTNGAGTQI